MVWQRPIALPIARLPLRPMSEWSAEERLEQIRGILGQTTRRRHVRDADGTLLDGTTLDWIAEIQRTHGKFRVR